MYTALEDIKLETIDFGWIKETTKIAHLKRAIKLIEMDGNYFSELKDACYQRIGELDPSQKRVEVDNRMMPEVKAQIEQELEEWQNQIGTQQKKVTKTQGPLEGQNFDPEAYFLNNKENVDKRKAAEGEKVKGNQAIKSKDYHEAIKYYNRSIELDPTLHQAYGNRALAYIRLKQFQKALNDCEEAIKIDSKYTKAYHRKATALKGIKNRVEAYKALQEALKLEPDNSQINGELKDLREEMNEGEIQQLQGSSKFKKIAIQEDSQSEGQEEIKQN